ncbi:MAG: F0F1 ATP synthase subunit A [Bdellovibrionales bacterium]
MAAGHFNWTQFIPGVGSDVHVATAAVVGGLLVAASFVAKAKLGKGDQAVEPAGEFGVKALFESFTDLMVYLCDMVLGAGKRKFVPLFGAIFVFVLFNNYAGLLPGMTPATDNLNTTLAIGMFSFLAYNYFGIREHGFGYLKHFLGPVIWLAPLMLPIELISHAVRPASLGLRLAGNMTGDHTVLGIFLDLAPAIIPVVFYGVGTFVCTIQAFVFTLLSMVYVSMSISHDH